MSQSSSYVEFSLLVMSGFVMYERESRSRSESWLIYVLNVNAP
jgi:hypothetical protein